MRRGGKVLTARPAPMMAMFWGFGEPILSVLRWCWQRCRNSNELLFVSILNEPNCRGTSRDLKLDSKDIDEFE